MAEARNIHAFNAPTTWITGVPGATQRQKGRRPAQTAGAQDIQTPGRLAKTSRASKHATSGNLRTKSPIRKAKKLMGAIGNVNYNQQPLSPTEEHEPLAPEATSTSRKGLKGHMKSAYVSTKRLFKGRGDRKYQPQEHGDPMNIEENDGLPSNDQPEKAIDDSIAPTDLAELSPTSRKFSTLGQHVDKFNSPIAPIGSHNRSCTLPLVATNRERMLYRIPAVRKVFLTPDRRFCAQLCRELQAIQELQIPVDVLFSPRNPKNIHRSLRHGVRYILCGEDREWPELDLHVPNYLWVWSDEIGDLVCPMSGLLATEFAEAYLRSIRRNLSDCLPGCGHRARVITGVGDGKNFNALKERLETLLDKGDLVEKLDFQDDNGAIVITLTKYNDDVENPLNMYGDI